VSTHHRLLQPLPRRALFTTALAGGTILGMGRSQVARAEAPVRGGNLAIALFPEPSLLTAALTTAGPTTIISGKVFDGLLTYGFDLKPQPLLATDWKSSRDGLAITLTLRPGVTWHDGKSFTSADVAYSVMEIWKKYHGRGRSTYANVVGVDTPDPTTAILRLAKPAPFILNALASMESQVLPRHLYENTDPLTNPRNVAPIGTGPFQFVEWQRGGYVLLKRYPGYWDQPKPYLDQIVYRFIPDAGSRAAALESGDVQMVGESSVPGHDIGRLGKLPQIELDTRGYEYGSSIALIEFNLDRPAFKDVRVRQAIAHALNREFIGQAIWYGYGKPATGPIPPSFPAFYSADVPLYPFDQKRAIALLDEAGLKPDGAGTRLSITHDYMPYGEPYQLTGDYFREALGHIGIKVSIRTQDYAAFAKRVYTDRDFDTTNYSAATGPDPAIGVQRFYWSRNFHPGVAFSNGSHYVNAEVDSLLESAQVEVDPKRRHELYARFQALAQRDLPEIPLVAYDQVTLTNKRLREHTTTAEGIHSNFAGTYLLPA